MPDLTPLETVSAIDASLRTKLADYWITTAEEFVSTARSSNRTYGNGLGALGQVLQLEQSSVTDLVKAARAALPPGSSFDVGAELQVGMGAIFEGMELPPATSFALPLELPDEVFLAQELPPPQNQGKRSTCVAFALAAMYQHASGDNSDLSEQFIYWASKERDGVPPHIRGTRPDAALAALRDLGVCAEATWPYVVEQKAGSEGQGPPPEAALVEATRRRISGFTSLPPKDVRQLQATLAKGQMILLGMPVTEHWVDAWQSRTLGRVRKPLPGEAPLEGHALCAVGYRSDQAAPGGGYFIVRNSWGIGWATENPDGAGYCHLPYRLVYENNIVALTIDGVFKEAIVASSGEAAAGAGTNEFQSLYEEARAIQQQLNALVERLAALAQTDRPV